MKKHRSHQELLNTIKKTDLMEAVSHIISRSTGSGTKKNEQRRFDQEITKMVSDERDVILIAIKVR